MSTIVGTNIEVTNLKYDSDTTSMIISNTGQVTIQGEGTATTNLQQGLAKHWVSFDGSAGTPTPEDSFNTASLTDNDTGNFSANFTSPMANGNFFSCGDANARRIVNSEGRTTARHNIRVYSDSTPSDRSGSRGFAAGDLA